MCLNFIFCSAATDVEMLGRDGACVVLLLVQHAILYIDLHILKGVIYFKFVINKYSLWGIALTDHDRAEKCLPEDYLACSEVLHVLAPRKSRRYDVDLGLDSKILASASYACIP